MDGYRMGNSKRTREPPEDVPAAKAGQCKQHNEECSEQPKVQRSVRHTHTDALTHMEIPTAQPPSCPWGLGNTLPEQSLEKEPLRLHSRGHRSYACGATGPMRGGMPRPPYRTQWGGRAPLRFSINRVPSATRKPSDKPNLGGILPNP